MPLTAYDVTIFGINIDFNSVAFKLPIAGGWSIYWYGICIALGFLLAVIYCFTHAKYLDINVDRLTDVVLVTTPLAILCSRLYYIIFYSKNDLKIDSIADFFGFNGSSGVSGLAIYGAVIGAAVFGLLMCKIRKVNILDAFDIASVGFLIGQACGRWGNFFNQEAYGSLTESSFWGMRNTTTILENVHPCFLYESIWCLLGFLFIHFFVIKKRQFKGQICLTYCVWYGFGRFFIEGLRTDSLYIWYFKVSQVLSFLLVAVCLPLLILGFKRVKNAKKATTYSAMFDDVQVDDDMTVKGVAYYEGEGEGTAEDADGATVDGAEVEAEVAEPEADEPETAEPEAADENKSEDENGRAD